MKLSFTRATMLLAVFMLFYTACKKNTVKPAEAAANVDYGSLSSQTGVLLYKSITGYYGGADVSKGIASPFSVKTGGRAVFSNAPLCGFVVDTSYNYTISTGTNINSLTDTLKTRIPARSVFNILLHRGQR